MAILDECGLALEKDAMVRAKQKVEESTRQEALRADLLRAISHDLRTPLTSISGNAAHHEISAELTDNLLMADMDARLIVHAIISLINNAIKHTPSVLFKEGIGNLLLLVHELLAFLLYVAKAAHIMLAINRDRRKGILSVWISGHESAKFWAGVLNELKNRGVQPVYLFCVDGLPGFQKTINTMSPKAQIQRCVIHQIRSSAGFPLNNQIRHRWATSPTSSPARAGCIWPSSRTCARKR